MNIYHVCYIIKDDLCSGINIKANDYNSALKKFNRDFTDKKIIYISEINQK
jgi:hypothetical protein